MTQEDKELLLKDLCARLPYGVKYMDLWNPDELPTTLCDINVDVELIMNTDGFSLEVEKCKPYLFPLSSITEEQGLELFNLLEVSFINGFGEKYIKINEVTGITFFFENGFDVETHLDKLLYWLNRNHFDYRGLIEKGLAIDATGLNIY